MPENMRVALWQCEPSALPPAERVAANLGRLARTAAAASAGGARLLIAPEMFITGYNLDPATARALADPVGGAVAQAVAALASAHGLAILYGCAEVTDDGNVYNAARLVDRTGEAVATHYKTHLFGEIDRRCVTAGTESATIVEIDRWRLGILICYEVEFPELTRALAVDGVDAIIVPTANMPDYDAVQRVLLPARAFENQVYVAYANYCGAEGDLAYGGLSEVASPNGELLVQAGQTEELLFAELSRSDLAASRKLNTYLVDRRPELY